MQKSGFDSLPEPITATRYQSIFSHTSRLNYDRTMSPTTVLHLGSGYIRYLNPDSAPDAVLKYDAARNLGFVGGVTNPGGFPRITGLTTGTNNSFGGMSLGMGPANANYYFNDKWTSVASLTKISGNHSLKFGGELRVDIFTDRNSRGAQGVLAFSNSQTGLPATQALSLPSGTGVGLNYASFMLGMVNNASVNALQDPQWRKTSWAFYAQDTWKITRKLTLDYGLRWDYEQPGHEIWNRVGTIGFSTPNPSAGGRPGGMIYAGKGPGRCNCDLAPAYTKALGPRLGVAYQLDPKTVIRGGWGVSYGNVTGLNYITNQVWNGVGFNSLAWDAPGQGDPAVLLRTGLQYNPADLYKTTLDPGVLPVRGLLNGPAVIIDPSWGRPPRINMWSVGIQREVVRNLVVEAAWVGNRGAWLNGPGLAQPNAISTERLASFGLNLANAADRTLLTSRIDSAAVAARGFKVPYDGFPVSATLAQSLRPYPQFNSTLVARNASLGNSWYDSLQAKVTKRYSHGLDFSTAFTWSKNLDRLTAYNDAFNRANQKVLSPGASPLVLTTAFTYETQNWFKDNKFLRFATAGWTFSGTLRYSSGTVINSPVSTNLLNSQVFQPTVFNRVPGEPLFSTDLNSNFDANKQLVLNPKAWVDAAPGTFGTSANAYDNYRTRRTPDEQLSIGRNFKIGESKMFSVRAEFFNVFNRTVYANPTSTSPTATTTFDKAGNLTAGYGFINQNSNGQPRNGQLVGRFTF